MVPVKVRVPVAPDGSSIDIASEYDPWPVSWKVCGSGVGERTLTTLRLTFGEDGFHPDGVAKVVAVTGPPSGVFQTNPLEPRLIDTEYSQVVGIGLAVA